MYIYIKNTYQLRHVSIVHSSNTRGRVFIHSLYHPGGHTLRVVQNSSCLSTLRVIVNWLCSNLCCPSSGCALRHVVVLCHRFDIFWLVGGRTTGGCNWLVFVIVTFHST